MGDNTTPLGDFTITEIRHSERFELFMAFDYPNLEHTERAFEDKRIDAQEYRALRYDLDRGNPPPQGTSLGGDLGIHGIGDGDLRNTRIHQLDRRLHSHNQRAIDGIGRLGESRHTGKCSLTGNKSGKQSLAIMLSIFENGDLRCWPT